MYDQNPDCDAAGCTRPALWILLSDLEGSDSLLCALHLEQLSESDPARACLFGPLNKIVIRAGVPSRPPTKNT